MENDSNLEEGDVSCINLTIVNGGVQYNVIPVAFSATFDIRLVPDLDLKAFEKQVCSFCKIGVKFKKKVIFFQLHDWCTEAGGGIEIEFLMRDDNTPSTVTHLNDDNKYWVEFRKALQDDL